MTASRDAAVGLNVFVLYASALYAVGTALFALTVGLPAGASTRPGRWAALIAALAFVLAVGLGGGNLLGEGADTLLGGAAWRLAFGTTLGTSAVLGVPAMLGLAWGLQRGARAGLAVGVVLGMGAFLVTGHAATAAPPWLTAPAVGIHIAAVAFWLGALVPLSVVARMQTPVAAAAVMQRFSRMAVVAVAALIASGMAITLVQMPGYAGFMSTDYGVRLLLKLAAFAGLLTLATVNKFVLTPRLEEGDAETAQALRRAIVIELCLFAVIIGAAAALSLAEPPRSL